MTLHGKLLKVRYISIIITNGRRVSDLVTRIHRNTSSLVIITLLVTFQEYTFLMFTQSVSNFINETVISSKYLLDITVSFMKFDTDCVNMRKVYS